MSDHNGKDLIMSLIYLKQSHESTSRHIAWFTFDYILL